MLPNPMSDYQPQATYFCIDIEANGPVPSLYDMVSLGAVVVYADDKGSLHIGNQLLVSVDIDFAYKMCSSLEHLTFLKSQGEVREDQLPFELFHQAL